MEEHANLTEILCKALHDLEDNRQLYPNNLDVQRLKHSILLKIAELELIRTERTAA